MYSKVKVSVPMVQNTKRNTLRGLLEAHQLTGEGQRKDLQLGNSLEKCTHTHTYMIPASNIMLPTHYTHLEQEKRDVDKTGAHNSTVNTPELGKNEENICMACFKIARQKSPHPMLPG